MLTNKLLTITYFEIFTVSTLLFHVNIYLTVHILKWLSISSKNSNKYRKMLTSLDLKYYGLSVKKGFVKSDLSSL